MRFVVDRLVASSSRVRLLMAICKLVMQSVQGDTFVLDYVGNYSSRETEERYLSDLPDGVSVGSGGESNKHENLKAGRG
jgi:hypothetical protein